MTGTYNSFKFTVIPEAKLTSVILILFTKQHEKELLQKRRAELFDEKLPADALLCSEVV